MSVRAVNVVQSHTLGIAVAKDRIESMLEKHKNDDPHITAGDYQWRELTHSFTCSLNAYGAPVVAHIQIEATFVNVTTDDIPGPWPVVWYGVGRANSKIASMLSESLKP